MSKTQDKRAARKLASQVWVISRREQQIEFLESNLAQAISLFEQNKEKMETEDLLAMEGYIAEGQAILDKFKTELQKLRDELPPAEA